MVTLPNVTFIRFFIPAQSSMSDRKVVHMVVVKGQKAFTTFSYSSGMVNSNTVNSNMVNLKFHFIRSFCEIFSYHFMFKIHC